MATEHASTSGRGKSALSGDNPSAVDAAKRDAAAIAKAVEGRAEERFDAVKEQAAGRVEVVASAVDALARELRDRDEKWLGDQAEALAATLRRTGQNVQERHIDGLTEDVRQWSKHPAVFLGGAFALGLVAGRFLKSSARQSESRQDLGGPPYGGLQYSGSQYDQAQYEQSRQDQSRFGESRFGESRYGDPYNEEML